MPHEGQVCLHGVKHGSRIEAQMETRKSTVVRPAMVDDAEQIATVHVAAWQKGFSGLLPDDFLDSLSITKRASYWRSVFCDLGSYLLVAEEEEQVKGFVHYGVCRDEDMNPLRAGEIYAIYVAPNVWGMGYGSALFEEVLNRLESEGFTSLSLWVLKGNWRARRFYEKLQLWLDGTQRVTKHPAGVDFHEVRYQLKRLG